MSLISHQISSFSTGKVVIGTTVSFEKLTSYLDARIKERARGGYPADCSVFVEKRALAVDEMREACIRVA